MGHLLTEFSVKMVESSHFFHGNSFQKEANAGASQQTAIFGYILESKN